MVKKLTDQIKETVKTRKALKNENRRLIPTGVTLLNLACSGKSDVGLSAGRVTNLIGDSKCKK